MSLTKSTYFLGLILVPFLNICPPISCAKIPVNIAGDVLDEMLQQAKQLKGNDFALWNIKDGVPVLFGINQTVGVSRHDHHIILQRIRENQEEWNLSYWIPHFLPRFVSYNNGPDDFTVAAYTMALDQVLNENSSYHYSRESKGIVRHQDIHVFNTCLIKSEHNEFKLKDRRRRFVLLEEQNVVIIRQGVPLGAYLYKNHCAVLYTVSVYVFCGNKNISNRLRSAAHTLGNLMKEEIQKYDPHTRYIEVEYGKTVGLSTQELWDAQTFYYWAGFNTDKFSKLPELKVRQDSNAFIIKTIWKEQTLLTLSKDTDDTNWYTFVQQGPLFKSMLKTDECHIVLYREEYHDDIFFLWIGTESIIEDRIIAAIKVEQTVSTFYSSYRDGSRVDRMTVPVIVEGKEPLEFKAIFVDWIDEENHNYVEILVNTIRI